MVRTVPVVQLEWLRDSPFYNNLLDGILHAEDALKILHPVLEV